jgi:hypothetical protein
VVLEPGLGQALLRVPLEGSARIEGWPVAPGARATVVVTRHDVYAPDARIFKVEGDRYVAVPRSSLVFFWGDVEGEPLARVLLWVDPGSGAVSGQSQTLEGRFVLQAPAAGGQEQLVAREEALDAAEPFRCGNDLLPQSSLPEPRAATGDPQPAITSLHTAKIAVDTDNELMSVKFSDNTTTATNYLAQLFAALNVIYERDFLVRLVQGDTYLRVSTTADPYTANSNGNASSSELSEVAAYWSANAPYNTVQRALVMMLSGKQPTGGASGIAYLNGLCSTFNGYSFSKVFKSASLGGSSDAMLVGHELGHNFGSPHTHCTLSGDSGPIDTCYADSCYSGPTSCPAPATYQGVANVRGTIMSYCHLLAGCGASPVFHSRTVSYLQPAVQSKVNACIFPLNQVSLSIADASVAETNTTTNATFTVTLGAASTNTVTASWATEPGTALAGTDYTTSSGTLTFAPGVTTQTLNVPVLGDTLDEANETFKVTLSNPVNAGISSATATGTISDDDPLPSISIGNVSLTEGNAGPVTASFTLSLSPVSGRAVAVGYASTNGSASAGSDYTAVSGILTLAAGQTQGTIDVTVLGDRIFEGNETFNLGLASPNNVTLGTATGVGTINNDDAQGLSVDDVTAREGLQNAAFTVTLSPAVASPVTVNYATANGTATAGSDYTSMSGTLTFAASETSKTLDVPVARDTSVEGAETFTVTLSGAAGAAIAYTQGTGTIKDAPLAPGDLGADGKSDIVWRKTAAGVDKGAMFLWTMNGTGLGGARYLDPIAEDWQVQFTGDFNGDGKADVLWRNLNIGAGDAGNLYIWMMDGPNVIGGTGYPASQADLGWRVDGVGDLNGDGKSDIVWRKTGAGVDKGAVFLWTMNGTGLAGARYLDPISEDWQVIELGDFNGDGKTDVLWRNFGTGSDAGKLYIWMMDGPNVIGGTGYTASQADLGWRVDGVGDLNGDGKSDIVWRKTGAGVDKGAMFLWTMNGTGLAGARYLDPISEDWQVQGLGDFNGDGKTDVLWRNQGPGVDIGNLFVWVMDGPNVVGGTGYTAAQADMGWRVDSPRSRVATVPQPLLPTAGAVLDNGCTSGANPIVWDFAWTGVAGASTYNVYVIHTGAANPVINEMAITETTYRDVTNGAYIANANRLDWRFKVRAYVAGVWGAFGPERSFDVEPVNTDCPGQTVASRPPD